MILVSVGGLMPGTFRSPSGNIDGSFEKGGDNKTGAHETQPSPLHAKSYRLGSRQTMSVEVMQAVELLLGLRDVKSGPDSWQKRIMVNFEYEQTRCFFPRLAWLPS
jgi:hypothetical protein